ncbi:fus1 [Acrasis kona]|uniref:Fus1 n=1 Tax=Acrasis kona TaxID=1008807 RepID=A0AAW2ZJ97_9EUKA
MENPFKTFFRNEIDEEYGINFKVDDEIEEEYGINFKVEDTKPKQHSNELLTLPTSYEIKTVYDPKNATLEEKDRYCRNFGIEDDIRQVIMKGQKSYDTYVAYAGIFAPSTSVAMFNAESTPKERMNKETLTEIRREYDVLRHTILEQNSVLKTDHKDYFTCFLLVKEGEIDIAESFFASRIARLEVMVSRLYDSFMFSDHTIQDGRIMRSCSIGSDLLIDGNLYHFTSAHCVLGQCCDPVHSNTIIKYKTDQLIVNKNGLLVTLDSQDVFAEWTCHTDAALISSRNFQLDLGAFDYIQAAPYQTYKEIGRVVYKFGAASGVTIGAIVKMPPTAEYYSGVKLENLIAVEGKNGNFATHGDSSSLVYTGIDGYAHILGYVVGGDESGLTFVAPLSSLSNLLVPYKSIKVHDYVIKGILAAIGGFMVYRIK